MMNAQQNAPRIEVPYLPESRIERAAEKIIAEYEYKFGVIEELVIPLDEIAESLCGLDLRNANLSEMYGANTLGAIHFERREVRIDDSLNPDVHPDKIGRYRFTLAHELGHWVLHEPVYRARRQQASLFDAQDDIPVVCRIPQRRHIYPPIEWQANYFAGCLTMPYPRVMRAWEIARGTRAPYIAINEANAMRARWTLAEDTTPTLAVSRNIADLLKVSAQAMQIRLCALNLIRFEAPVPQLLSTREIEASYGAPGGP